MKMKLPILSGSDMVKLLSKTGFQTLEQHGSHVILLKTAEGRKLKPVVPLHRELAIGTLLSILKQAGLSREKFIELYEGKR